MTLEWLRRRDPALDRNLRTYLFTTGPVTGIEAEVEAGSSGSSGGGGEPTGAERGPSLGIGSLKGVE
jgi:hypothetical protein